MEILQLWKKQVLNELTLQYYELWVTEGIEAAIHGVFHKITEIYVPELKMAINMDNSKVNVILCDTIRYDVKRTCMSGNPSKFIKTVTIRTSSDVGKNLIWLEEGLRKKKETEEMLASLFKNL